MAHRYYNLPVYTRNTAVQVRSVLRCAKIPYHTRTCVTRFGNTAGKPVPVGAVQGKEQTRKQREETPKGAVWQDEWTKTRTTLSIYGETLRDPWHQRRARGPTPYTPLRMGMSAFPLLRPPVKPSTKTPSRMPQSPIPSIWSMNG